MPKDPSTNAAYNYCMSGVKYQIAAELEQPAAALKSDADLTQADIGAGTCKDGTADTACTTAADDCVYDQGAK